MAAQAQVWARIGCSRAGFRHIAGALPRSAQPFLTDSRQRAERGPAGSSPHLDRFVRPGGHRLVHGVGLGTESDLLGTYQAQHLQADPCACGIGQQPLRQLATAQVLQQRRLGGGRVHLKPRIFCALK